MSADATLLWKRSRRLLADYALLAVLDARRAALQLAVALSALLAATVLATTAWLACVVAAVAWVQGHAGWPGVLALAALVNVLAGAALIWWARGRFTERPFAATLRQLQGEPDDEPRDETTA